jgi:hypothetical protein
MEGDISGLARWMYRPSKRLELLATLSYHSIHCQPIGYKGSLISTPFDLLYPLPI